MMKDYKQQFEGLTNTVDSYNGEIDKLRTELYHTQGSYFDLRSKQHVLESEVEALKIRKELTIGLNEERRLQQLKISIMDSERRSSYLESEVQVVFERWQGKIALVKKAVTADSEHRQAEVLSELTEKYMATIFEKNKQTVDVARVKEEIDTQITSRGHRASEENQAEMLAMQQELDDLLADYEGLIG